MADSGIQLITREEVPKKYEERGARGLQSQHMTLGKIEINIE
jgi:hypothetical protein